MSVTTENAPVQGQTTLQENRAGEGVYASLFEKINLAPASRLGDINDFLDDAALSEAPAAERLTAAMQVFMERIRQSGQRVEKLDKTLIDHHIAELDFQISRQLDAVMHHQEFQQVESLWRGLKQLVDNTDYRQNVKTEILDVAKDDLRQDFEDAPELIQSGLYWHTYTAEYDTPGGEPIGSVISAYEFDASPQDVALLRNISRVSAAAHMPFIGAVGPAFFLKETMEEVAAIKDIGNYFDRAEYIRWKAFRETRLTAAMQVFMERIRQSGQRVEKLDKTLIDHHIAELDFQISRQLDAVMHHQEFQQVESLWRGLKQLVDNTDYRQNVKTEILDVAKDDLRQDFEDASELIQSGLYWHTYTAEYDTPGGEPIGSVISAYEFDASPQDVALLRNISRVSAAAHMPFIGAVGPAFFLKETMEEVAAIKDIGNYFDRAEYIRWKAFRETDDARYIGLVMPRVLGRLPYGPDTVPVRSFNYVEQVKGPDHEKYLWTSAAFSFASNMVKSFVNNGWCVQIRGPQAGGAVKDLPIHLYDLGTGNQVKIPSEVMIPETREFEFASLGFIPLSYYKNRDYACFFSANSAQKPALYDTADATANSRRSLSRAACTGTPIPRSMTLPAASRSAR
ncbi:type VI secretion protein EvpB [Klebsiella pneumoniae]|nr:type VI secretion protein EvpB [Klebsiella pneumoniae]